MEDKIIRKSLNSKSGNNISNDNKFENNSSIIRRRNSNLSLEEESSSDQRSSNTQIVQYRIGLGGALILIFLAVGLDVTEILLDVSGTLLGVVGVVIGYLKDFVALIILPGILLLLGAPFWKGRKAKKKIVTMISSFLISLIPWVGAIMPETTIGILVTIYLTRKEDKERIEVKNKRKIIRSKRS
jgi:hypothetical protein